MRTLYDLALGERARIQRLRLDGEMSRRLSELGFLPGSEIVCLLKSPLGDPRAYWICDTLIALRGQDARGVELTEEAVGQREAAGEGEGAP